MLTNTNKVNTNEVHIKLIQLKMSIKTSAICLQQLYLITKAGSAISALKIAQLQFIFRFVYTEVTAILFERTLLELSLEKDD